MAWYKYTYKVTYNANFPVLLSSYQSAIQSEQYNREVSHYAAHHDYVIKARTRHLYYPENKIKKDISSAI